MSRHWLALSARTSLTPFLYQTPTLSAAFLNRRAPSPFRSSYSTSNSSKPDESAPATEGEHNASPDSSATSTEGAGQEKPRRSYLQRRGLAVSRTSTSAGLAPRSKTSSKAPSMTRAEKQVFNDLFEQIGPRTGSAEPKGPPTDRRVETLEDRRARSELDDERPSAEDQIAWIFDSVLGDIRKQNQPATPAGQKEEAPAKPIPAAFDAASIEEAAMELDPSSSAVISEGLQNGYLPMEEALNVVIDRESDKTWAALQSAATAGTGDQAVLEVCQKRIFSLLYLLADPASNTSADAAAADPAADPSLAPSDATPERTAILAEYFDIPPEIPVESVVSALYPKSLLDAFRTLNLHFPQSPLIDQFRTTIKSHGRTSAVLGASTGLYNEMIYFYWAGCRDLPGVVSLLQEMELMGVEPNERMCAQLKGIRSQRWREVTEYSARMQDEKGLTFEEAKREREPWWDLMPNRLAMYELIEWIDKLEKHMKEKKRREKDERWMKGLV